MVDRPPVANSDATAGAAGQTVTTNAASGVLSNDTDLDRDTLSIIGVSDAAHGAGSVDVSLAGLYGHLTRVRGFVLENADFEIF
jgi:Bacterial cadherin-like domain